MPSAWNCSPSARRPPCSPPTPASSGGCWVARLARWPSIGWRARERRPTVAARSSCSRETTHWWRRASGSRSAGAAAPGSPRRAPGTSSPARSPPPRRRGGTRRHPSAGMSDLPVQRAVAVVDDGAVARNCARLRRELRGGAVLCAVVKANGYGHGALPCARAALEGGASWLAVAAAAEAAELRGELVEVPILTMGALTVAELDVALRAASD